MGKIFGKGKVSTRKWPLIIETVFPQTFFSAAATTTLGKLMVSEWMNEEFPLHCIRKICINSSNICIEIIKCGDKMLALDWLLDVGWLLTSSLTCIAWEMDGCFFLHCTRTSTSTRVSILFPHLPKWFHHLLCGLTVAGFDGFFMGFFGSWFTV